MAVMSAPVKHRCVLVADDAPYLPVVIAHMLGLEPGLEVLTANSGRAAQEHFAERHIDVVLTDPLIGSPTGFELLRWVQEHYPQTLRLFMTASIGLESQLDESVQSGLLAGYLWKPFTCEELRRFIEEMLGSAD
jgi:DNA-binding NtrC family response regulator